MSSKQESEARVDRLILLLALDRPTGAEQDEIDQLMKTLTPEEQADLHFQLLLAVKGKGVM